MILLNPRAKIVDQYALLYTNYLVFFCVLVAI